MNALLLLTSLAMADWVDPKKEHDMVMMQSFAVMMGNSYTQSKSHLGLDYNLDLSKKRWEYSHDFHIYDTNRQHPDYRTMSASRSIGQYKAGFMLTDHLKVFGMYRREYMDFRNVSERYQPSVGVGWAVLRQSRIQCDVLVGGLLDVAESPYFSSLYVVPRNALGTSGYYLTKKKAAAINWYSWVLPSMLDVYDYRVVTNVDIDVHVLGDIYARTNIHSMYETERVNAAPSETRWTVGFAWSPLRPNKYQ